jgi:hypothetical protein
MPNRQSSHRIRFYLRILSPISVVITHQVRSFPQAFNNELMALCPTVDILDIIRRGLEVAGCVVALGYEDVVIHTALERLVQWNWGALRMSADLEG